MADLQSLLNAKAARDRIWAIPGVRRIGFGLKETAGEVQPRWVFRVYVDAKRPAEELTAEELIPSRVEGFDTDVLIEHESRLECGGPALRPGREISVGVNNNSAHPGTLGCLVQKGVVFSALTCQHVIAIGSGKENVYQLIHKEDNVIDTLVGKAGEKFREAMPLQVGDESRRYWIDCGLVPLAPKLEFENTLARNSLNPHIRDLSTELLTPAAAKGVRAPVSPPTITKEGFPPTIPRKGSEIGAAKIGGAKTGVATGTVVEVCSEAEVGGEQAILWLLSSKLASSEVNYSATYEVSVHETKSIEDIINEFKGESVTATRLDPAGRRIRFGGPVFSIPGDSGAIWFDGENRPVGLHSGGKMVHFLADGYGRVSVFTGRGEACHIAAVFSKLGLDPKTGIVSGTKSTAGTTVSVPNAIPDLRLEIEQELRRSEAGRALLTDLRRSEAEVRKLIDHRRRVTLVWHRHKGPAFVATAINLAREGRTEISREVAGVQAVDLVRAMLDVLGREGSAELRETVGRLRPVLLRLVEDCETLDELTDCLEATR